MDTSKEYIEMRLQARSWMGIGDSMKSEYSLIDHHEGYLYSVVVDCVGNYYIQYNGDTNGYVSMLEKQDQLQDMIEIELFRKLERFHYLIMESYNNRNPLDYFKSYEQLWLALVMQYKYSKQWTDNDWR